MKTTIIAMMCLTLITVNSLYADPLVDSVSFSEASLAQESHCLPVADALVLTVLGLGIVGWGRRHRWVS